MTSLIVTDYDTRDPPAGWYYEDADPEAGIGRGMWVDEDCPLGDTKTTETYEVLVPEADSGPVLYKFTETCSCGTHIQLWQAEDAW